MTAATLESSEYAEIASTLQTVGHSKNLPAAPSHTPIELTAPVDFASESRPPQSQKSEPGELNLPRASPITILGNESTHDEEARTSALQIEISKSGSPNLAHSPIEFTNSPELGAGDSPASLKRLLEEVTNELHFTFPTSEEGAMSASRQSTIFSPTPPTLPIKLLEFLVHIYPGEVFKNLELNDILQFRLVSREFKNLVDDYLRDVILPFTRLIFRFKTPPDLEYPDKDEIQYEHLVPVIKRVEKGHRVFPHGRIVYEPEERGTKKYRLNKFQPYQIEVVLSDERERKFTMELKPTRTEGSHRQGERRSHLLTFEYNKVHQYYRFDSFDKLPVHIFYKDRTEGDSVYVELHCISIPVEFLRREVLRDRDENMRRARTRSRTANRLPYLDADFFFE
jgi:hypothetical protein